MHCTNCGAQVAATDRFCAACGNTLGGAAQPAAAPAGDEAANVATLMGMAKTAEIGGNNAEALQYFNRVLEIDPTNADAWVGKGKSAAWQSTLANLRLSECMIAFQHAIANSGAHRQVVTSTVVLETNTLVTALYSIARSHMVEFASQDKTWASYIQHVAVMLDALEEARKWEPENRLTLGNIVTLCKDNIEGYTFRDRFNNNAPVLHEITPKYEGFLRALMDGANATLLELDPGYQAPSVQKKKADACFVVTATMGDFDHPDVKLLRQFRDSWIMQQRGGRSLVSFYYRIGPTLAGWIGGSDRRRSVAYRLIVKPAVGFARKRMG